jgi:hypothetical protein
MSGVVRGDWKNRTFRPLFSVMGMVSNSLYYKTQKLKNRQSNDFFIEKIVSMKNITIFASLIKYHEADKTITTRQNSC